MKKVLISAILIVGSLNYTFANANLNDFEKIVPKDNSDKIIIISKNDNANLSNIQAGKTRVTVEEIENDDLGLEKASIKKEIEVISTEFVDDNFVYVKERKDLIGYALQMASFSDLTLAKDYALTIARNGDAEKRQLFIYTVSSTEKVMYKVYFGLLKTNESARQKQRTFLSLGYSPFVKEFR